VYNIPFVQQPIYFKMYIYKKIHLTAYSSSPTLV